MPDVWALAAIVAKLALYGGGLTATGLVLVRLVFPTLLAPQSHRLRGLATMGALIALVAAALGFVLRGAALTGSAAGMSDPEILSLLWQTPVGEALVLRLFGLGLLLLGLWVPRIGWALAACGGVIALWSFTAIGHMSEQEGLSLRLLLWLHLGGVAFWIGVLSPLRHLTRQPVHHAEAAQLGHRFGRLAALIVPVLAVAGAVMAWALVGSWATLVSTGYGLALLAKVALVALLLSLAALNKLRFVPGLLAGDTPSARALERVIQGEAVLFALILAATAILTSVMTLPM